MAAAVQHRGLAAHAQHAQGEEGFCLHVSVQRQKSFENKMQFQVKSVLSNMKIYIFRTVVCLSACRILNYYNITSATVQP